jgi:hypothetical protein
MNVGLPFKEFGESFFNSHFKLVELIFNDLNKLNNPYSRQAMRHKYEIYRWLYEHERNTEVSKLELMWKEKTKQHEAKKDFKG